MNPEEPAPYREARRAGRDAVAERLLDLADARLAAEGPAGISMRRLANAAGCSTMVFYTAFGTKAGLLGALAEREAERWIDEVLTLADPDPVAWLDATGRALLEIAAARPHHRDLVLAPGSADTIGVAVQAAVRRAWPGPSDEAGPVSAAVWAAWRGALGSATADGAVAVHVGVALLWSAAVQRAGPTTS